MIIKIVVADDEEMCRLRICRLLNEGFPEVEIAAQAADGFSALNAIDMHKPDLVFLDIEMPGLTGLEVASKSHFKPAIIFVTAYNSYAIDAFKTMAIDYILKPIQPDQLSGAIKKYSQLKTVPNYEHLLSKLLNKSEHVEKKRLRVHVGGMDKFILFNQIICIESDCKYSTIFTIDKTYISEETLCSIESFLPATEFIRINRNQLVNFQFIDGIEKWFNQKFKVVLNVPLDKELLVSRKYYDNIKKL